VPLHDENGDPNLRDKDAIPLLSPLSQARMTNHSITICLTEKSDEKKSSAMTGAVQ
jgi:hypothetical protein